MTAPAPDIATRLFASLQSAGCEVTAVELADILWLARYVPATRRSESDSTSPRTTLLSAPASPHPADAGADVDAEADAARKASSDAQSASARAGRDSHTADGLYARVERDARLARGRRATIVRAPAAPALPNALALSRALRPLLKKRVSRHRWQLDEEATAEATAVNHGIATPIFKPSPERWFEVALVVDGAPSMHVWHQAAGELRRLLIRHGGFRDLRQYRLRQADGAPRDDARGDDARRDDAGDIELISESGRRLTPNAISDPSGHRLIVILSDVVSPMWRELPIRQALFAWSRWSPVVLLDVLPRRMWPHTPIGFAERAMAPRRAGAPNVEWQVERDWWDADGGGSSVTLPVITLDADHFGRWARALMQVSAERCTGTVLPVEAVSEASIATAASAVASAPMSMPMTPLERIQQFRSASSAPAYQLACYFAATLPVLPVLRIVQRQMMPDTGPGHLAEFLLSGLVRPRTIDSARRASMTDDSVREDSARRIDPERIVYEFHPGVQDLLLAQLDAQEVSRIMPAIESYIKTHLGESYDLIALVPDARGAEQISAEALPFVKPAFDLMQRITGRTPRAAATVTAHDRLVRILRLAFPERDIDAYVEEASWLSGDEVRSHLIFVAIELMSEGQRELLLPLAVTVAAPNLPQRLWRSLFSGNMLAPLDLMDGVAWAQDDSLRVTEDVREALRGYVGLARTREMHRRIIEAYLGSDREPGTLDLPPFADAYFYHHIFTHVAGADDDRLARAIVSSPEWIENKVRVCGIADLVHDLGRFSHVPAIGRLARMAFLKAKEHESTQGWAESLIEEWSSLLAAETNAAVEVSTGEAAEDTSSPSTSAADATDAMGATEPTAAPAADAPPDVWVKVAGTGARALTNFERDVTSALGVRLASDGRGLICGHWQGVDSLVAESYANELARQGRTTQGKLMRILPSTGVGGEAESAQIVLTPKWAQELTDALVLIGGNGLTREIGHEAMTHFVPIIPVAATGGDAARLFQEAVHEQRFSPDDALNTPRGPERVARIVDRIAELVKEAEPSNQVLPLVETYLRTQYAAAVQRIEARILAVLRRTPNVDQQWALSERGPVRLCLVAFAYRVNPDPNITRDLFEPDSSPHVMLQRVRACEVAFRSRETRRSLPSDTEQRIESLNSTLDRMVVEKTHEAIARHARNFTMAARLKSLGRLATLAEQAASPQFDQFDDLLDLRLVAAGAVGRDIALDCLADPHPGWRLIGLGGLTGWPSQSPPPDVDTASRILQAARFEATFHSHLQFIVRAIDTMASLSLPIQLDANERAMLDRIREQVRSESRPATSAKTSARALTRLVERYHGIRRQPFSDARTGSMERVVSQMRRAVTEAEGFDVLARLNDNEPGWRLAAYAYVQQRPDAAFHVPLCRSLIKYRALPDSFDAGHPDNRAFGEYQGLLALEQVDEMLTKLSKDQRIAWEAVRRAIHVDAASNRGRILERITPRRAMPASLDRADQVGDFLREEGHFNAALRAYREALEFVQERAKEYEQAGNRAEALRFAERALAIAERLATLDQANPSWQTVAWLRENVERLGGKQSGEADERLDK